MTDCGQERRNKDDSHDDNKALILLEPACVGV